MASRIESDFKLNGVVVDELCYSPRGTKTLTPKDVSLTEHKIPPLQLGGVLSFASCSNQSEPPEPDFLRNLKNHPLSRSVPTSRSLNVIYEREIAPPIVPFQHKLIIKSNVGETGSESAMPTPIDPIIKKIYLLSFEQYQHNDKTFRMKKESENFCLIIDENGEFKWEFTEHFNPIVNKIPPTASKDHYFLMMKKISNAFHTLLTIIKGSRQLGFDQIAEKRILSLIDNDGRIVKQHTAVSSTLIRLFEDFFFSQSGRLLYNSEREFQRRVDTLYVKNYCRKMDVETQSILKLHMRCQAELTQILHTLSAIQHFKIQRFKKSSKSSKKHSNPTKMENLFEILGVKPITDRCGYEEIKIKFYEKLLRHPKIVCGFDGNRFICYGEFFEKATAQLNFFQTERDCIKRDLGMYINSSPFLVESRDEIQQMIIDKKYEEAVQKTFEHTTVNLHNFTIIYPEILRDLCLRACAHITHKDQKMNILEKVIRYTQPPVEWIPLENIIIQLANAMPPPPKK